MLVTGGDVARIARALAVAPWQFTQAVAAPPGDAMGFALDDSPRRYRLALARTQLDERPASCTFLIHAKGGAARCGLGALRPAPCATYPAQMIDGTVSLATSSCTCDWSDVDVAACAARDRTLLLEEERARALEARIAAAWNAFVATLAPAQPLAPRDYCRYLLDRYAEAAP